MLFRLFPFETRIGEEGGSLYIGRCGMTNGEAINKGGVETDSSFLRGERGAVVHESAHSVALREGGDTMLGLFFYIV